MVDEIADVTVVGGGDSGLLTALCIRQLNPDVAIRIVDDVAASRPDVGKSTFQPIVDILHEFLQIDEAKFVEEVKPIWKASVYFRHWRDRPPFHFPFDTYKLFRTPPNDRLAEQQYYHYDTVHPDPDYRTVNGEMVEQGVSPFFFAENGDLDRYPAFAYHLDTDRFNAFLRELCSDREITLVDDRIERVQTSEGRIETARGCKDEYISDLYVDASGFNRVLKSELPGSFVDFELPLDAACNTRLPRDLSDVEPATVIETGEHGWFWQIDTFDYRDVGYVYASEFVGREKAERSFRDRFDLGDGDHSIGHYTFTSGYYEDAWAGNCIAIGNAGGFIEPLQSTGLTANAQAASILSILLAAHDRCNHPGIRRTFNARVQAIWQTVYDFVCAHYRYACGGTPFWDRMSEVTGSDHLEAIVKEYDANGINTDVTALRHDAVVFELAHYYYIMRNMGATSAYYEGNSIEVGEDIQERIDAVFEGIPDRVQEYLTPEEFYRGLSASERARAIRRLGRRSR